MEFSGKAGIIVPTQYLHHAIGLSDRQAEAASGQGDARIGRSPSEGDGVHYYVASFPLEHAHEFQRAFRSLFPEHASAFVPDMRVGQVKMYVRPGLTREGWAQWKELYEAKCRELAL